MNSKLEQEGICASFSSRIFVQQVLAINQIALSSLLLPEESLNKHSEARSIVFTTVGMTRDQGIIRVVVVVLVLVVATFFLHSHFLKIF